MGGVPLGKSAYQRADLPPITLKNLYYEAVPVNLEDQVALIPRSRLSLFATAGAGPIRGLYRKGGVMASSGYSGQIICLSDDKLYRVHQTTGDAALIGIVEGPNRMSAEGNLSVVVLACGTKAYYTDGASLTQITFPDDRPVYAIDTLNSYFLFASAPGRFYWSAIGGTTVDALDYATAESQPDDLKTLKVVGDELWLFGRLSIEVWQPTGDLDLPFQRIGGRIFGIGITSADTAQKMNVSGVDTVCWVGTDGRVYRTNPNPVEISDRSMVERLSRADPATLYATTATDGGHDFYVLHIPGEGTWACDLSTGSWDEWSSYGRDLFRGAVGCLNPNNEPLLGDDASGSIFQMVATQNDDHGQPVEFEWTGRLEVPAAPQRQHNLLLECSKGRTTDLEADPLVQLAISDDDGATFDDCEAQPLGRTGERNTRVMWSRLGMLRTPGRTFRWRTTEPVVVRKARYNESFR